MSTTSLPPPPSLPVGIDSVSGSNDNAFSASSRILTNKVQNAISLNTTTPAFSSALTALSTLQTPTKIDARSIRTAIEQDALHQAKCLEAEMRRLVGVVKAMRSGIKNVVSIAEGVKDSVREVVPHDNNNSTDHFEEEKKLAEVLANAFQERNEARVRNESIREFMEKFDLSDGDSSLLENYNFEHVLESNNEGGQSIKDGMNFLNALMRVSKIRKELSSTFDHPMTDIGEGTDSSAAKLGPASAMRMVENLASKQDRAFERLYHFLHSRLDLSHASVAHVPTSSSAAPQPVAKIQDGMDETLLHPFIRRSIVVLYQVPAYYKHTLELIATSRRAEVTRKFLLALTSGYDGMPPIEMKAHDPVNYVGDMLAFMFRTTSVESELARGLFADKASSENEDSEENVGLTASQVLNDIVSGVARPLRSRLSQVISSLARRPDDEKDETVGVLHEEEAGTARTRLGSLYSICGLLLFYHSAMEKAAKKLEPASLDNTAQGSTNQLVQSLVECLSEGANAYATSLKVYVATLESLASLSNASKASVASEVVIRLCQVRNASPGYGIEADGIQEETYRVLALEFLCDTIMEPVLPCCLQLGDAVAMKTALNAMKKIGLGGTCASKWDTIISGKEQMMIDAEITSDTKNVLEDCGLGQIQNAIVSMEAVYVEGMTASSHPGLSEDSMQGAIKVFYAMLYDPPIPSYGSINDPVLRKYARNKVAENVAAVYSNIYELVKSEKGGYENYSFLTYDPSQINSMLSS